MSQEYIQAMRFWTNHQHAMGLPFDAEAFSMPDAQYWLEKMQEELEAAGVADDLIKPPEPFTKDKKESDWRPWSEAFITYTRNKKGLNNNIPLACILRENDVVDPLAIYPTEVDEKIGKAMLAGPQFAADNATVYDLLKSLGGNGPLWPFIQPYERSRNGQAAWKALVNFYDGDSMRSRTKAAAYQSIQGAQYQGPRRNFDIDTYISIHQRVYQDLAGYGEAVPELKKVCDFLDGITDPHCESNKLQV